MPACSRAGLTLLWSIYGNTGLNPNDYLVAAEFVHPRADLALHGGLGFALHFILSYYLERPCCGKGGSGGES